jgi:hypothetical protein
MKLRGPGLKSAAHVTHANAAWHHTREATTSAGTTLLLQCHAEEHAQQLCEGVAQGTLLQHISEARPVPRHCPEVHPIQQAARQ